MANFIADSHYSGFTEEAWSDFCSNSKEIMCLMMS
jgi:hypothetical protein